MLLFQFEGVAERWLTMDDWAHFREFCGAAGYPDADVEAAVTEQTMRNSAGHVTGPWRYERFEGCGHWLQLDAPDRLNTLLLEFLRSEPG